jgi:hypothetical protein
VSGVLTAALDRASGEQAFRRSPGWDRCVRSSSPEAGLARAGNCPSTTLVASIPYDRSVNGRSVVAATEVRYRKSRGTFDPPLRERTASAIEDEAERMMCLIRAAGEVGEALTL